MGNILEQFEFTNNQVRVYKELLNGGSQKASVIARVLGMKRALAYRTLAELQEIGLVKQDVSQKVTLFEPLHPSKLYVFGQEKLSQAQKNNKLLEDEINALTSEYNLNYNKPGVEFFEGIGGIKKVLNDTLTSSELVYTYTDITTINNTFKELNHDYIKRRKHLGVKKRFLERDTPMARKRYSKKTPENAELRLISKKDIPALDSVMHIYDGKVSYITFRGDVLAGTIIHDLAIYSLHRALFDDAWERADSLQ